MRITRQTVANLLQNVTVHTCVSAAMWQDFAMCRNRMQNQIHVLRVRRLFYYLFNLHATIEVLHRQEIVFAHTVPEIVSICNFT